MKLQVNVSDKLVELIDNQCEFFGMSRSAYCNMLISNGLIQTSKDIERLNKGVNTNEEV